MWQWTWSEVEERAYESTDMAAFVNVTVQGAVFMRTGGGWPRSAA
jgi:hypothetical protein